MNYSQISSDLTNNAGRSHAPRIHTVGVSYRKYPKQIDLMYAAGSGVGGHPGVD